MTFAAVVSETGVVQIAKMGPRESNISAASSGEVAERRISDGESLAVESTISPCLDLSSTGYAELCAN